MERGRTRRCAAQRATAWGAILAVSVLCGAASAGAADSSVEWLSLEKGLERARKEYRPLIIWYPGRTGDLPREADLARVVERPDVKRIAARFVLVRIGEKDLGRPYPKGPSLRERLRELARRPPRAGRRTPGPKGGARAGPERKDPKGQPDPAEKARNDKEAAESRPTVREALRIPGEKPAAVVLDYRERAVKRYDGGLPRASQLVRELGRISRVNAYYAKYARRAEPILAEAIRKIRSAQPRHAVQKLLALDKPRERSRLDPELRSELEKLLASLLDEGRKVLAEAARLEDDADRLAAGSEKKYFEALKLLEKAAADYPFPEILKETALRKGRILRKLTLGAPGP